MKLNDLKKNGDVVVLRNGNKYMLVDELFVGYETEGYIPYNTYNNDMMESDRCNGGEFDIIQVYRSINYNFSITKCPEKYMLWNKYEDDIVKWSEVGVDTPILVMNAFMDDLWVKRHFVKYENNTIYVWKDGMTSWTTNDTETWVFNKLPDDNTLK